MKSSINNPIAPPNLNGDEFLPVEYVSTDLHDPVRDRWDEGAAVGGVRLYCTQSPSFGDAARWHLQVRAQVKTKAGRPGKHFAISTASMSREALLWLRDAINAELRRKL
jgi:hypothetical protein